MTKLTLKLGLLVVLTGAYVFGTTGKAFSKLTPKACCTSTDGQYTCCGASCSAGSSSCGAGTQ